MMTVRVLARSDSIWDQAASSRPDHHPLADSHTGQAHPASELCLLFHLPRYYFENEDFICTLEKLFTSILINYGWENYGLPWWLRQ